ncbi:hypothetical protein A3B48_03210 [Candidatus Gottesmanbacteria bacterium RIFCSPLOWO2_01_FULL_40_10]|nr:MAG: hypothetical protein A3B48_03210 [Candidatus Gottesmanbacteria bacterium RIFCSPLOWO2_01_FULL_40_10]
MTPVLHETPLGKSYETFSDFIASAEESEADQGIIRLWRHFDNLSRIPRNTGKEVEARDYAVKFARERKNRSFEYEIDGAGNLLIIIPASEGLENKAGIVLQGHLDMVCAGKPDPSVYGVKPKVDDSGEWVYADNTTLGADNGIGISAMLSVADEEHKHGPIALIFTVREEAIDDGASHMDFKNELQGFEYLLNLDSEDGGKATISSASTQDAFIDLPVYFEEIGERTIWKLQVSNLQGGHSGEDIGENRMNALKILGGFFENLSDSKSEFSMNIVHIGGGSVHNAIPSEAELYFTAVGEDGNSLTEEEIRVWTDSIRNGINISRYNLDDKKRINIMLEESAAGSELVMDNKSSERVINLISRLAHGAYNLSEKSEIMLSVNLATVRTERDEVKIVSMIRGNEKWLTEAMIEEINKISREHGGSFSKSNFYPGWQADPEAEINSIAGKAWRQVTGTELELGSSHCSLECGQIIRKYPQLQAISLGAVIEGGHTIEERVNIRSVGILFEFVKKFVGAVPS